jgi:hypothetical protein
VELYSYDILVEKSQGKIPLVRLRCRWENNFETDVRAVECEVVDWINPIRWAHVNTLMNLGVP